MSKKLKTENKSKQKPQTTTSTWFVALLSIGFAATPIIAMYGMKFGYTPDLHMASWLHVFIAAIAALYWWQTANSKRTNLSITVDKTWYNPLWPLITVLIWMSLSLLWAQATGLAITRLIDWVIGFIGLCIAMQCITTAKSRSLLFLCLSLSVISVSVLGILQHIYDVNWLLQAAKPGSFFSNKNRAAQFIILLWPLLCYLWLNAQDKWHYYLTSSGLALTMVYITYTNTRAAWVGMVIQIMALVILCYWQHRQQSFNSANRRHQLLSLGLFIIICLWLIPMSENGWGLNQLAAIGGEANTIAQAMLERSDKDLRIIMWSNSLELIKHHWLTGVGLANWLVEYPAFHQAKLVDYFMTFSSQHNHAHNDYIELFAELGSIGFILILVLSYCIVNAAFKAIGNSQKEVSIAAICLFVGLLGLAVDSIFSFPLQKAVIIIFGLLILGVLLGLYQNTLLQPSSNRLKSDTYLINNASAKIYAALFVVLSIGLATLHYNWYLAEINKRQAIRAASKSNYDQVLQHAKRSYNLNPWQPTILNTIAIAHQQLGDIQKAVDTLELSFKTQPNSLYNLFNASDFYLKLNKFQKAQTHLKHLIDIRPNDYHTQQIYGKLLFYYIKDYPNAIMHLGQAIALTDDLNKQAELQQLIARSQQKIHGKK